MKYIYACMKYNIRNNVQKNTIYIYTKKAHF